MGLIPGSMPCTQAFVPLRAVLLLASVFPTLPTPQGPPCSECGVLAARAWEACACRHSIWEGISGVTTWSLLWEYGIPVH